MPTYQQAKRPYDDPDGTGPTGAVSFDQRLAANDATAKASAGRAVQAVGSAYNAAGRGLARESSAAATAGTALNPSESLTRQYIDAGRARENLATQKGVQQNLGPGASPWDAAMARVAGGKQLATGQSMYAPRDGDVGRAQKEQTDAMARALAEKSLAEQKRAAAAERERAMADQQARFANPDQYANSATHRYETLIAMGNSPEQALNAMSPEEIAQWKQEKQMQNGRTYDGYVTDAPAGG